MNDGDGEHAGGDQTVEGMARIVADADVLAADLLVGGTPREAMDLVRSHSWIALVASESLLTDTEAVIADLADGTLAADWREKIDELAEMVTHPMDDHPAIASAYHGGARHVLTFDESLLSATAATTIRSRVETSVKHPTAFVKLFDPASIYPEVGGGTYEGPDRDPRD